MRIHIPRLMCTILGIIALSWFLPNIYQKATRSDRFQLSGVYSPLLKEFVLWEIGNEYMLYKDERGKTIPQREARTALPFIFTADVNKWGLFPLTLDGRSVSYDEARLGSQSVRIRPRTVSSHVLPLYMLLESSPDGAALSMPPDVLRLQGDGLEFINCADGTVNSKKSEEFTRALKSEGAIFPLQSFASNPSPLKAFDEGAFVVDASNALFQLQMVQGHARCRATGIKAPGKVLHMDVVEHPRKAFYGTLITDQGFYLNQYGDSLQKMHVPGYTAFTHTVDVWFTPLGNSLVYSDVSDNFNREAKPVNYLASGGNYETLRTFAGFLPERIQQRIVLVEQGLSFLTPWILRQYSMTQDGIKLLGIPAPKTLFALLGIGASLVVYGVVRRLAKRPPAFVEIMLVALCGLPGLLALLAFGPLCLCKKSS